VHRRRNETKNQVAATPGKKMFNWSFSAIGADDLRELMKAKRPAGI
jgi:hypothetical protein